MIFKANWLSDHVAARMACMSVQVPAYTTRLLSTPWDKKYILFGLMVTFWEPRNRKRKTGIPLNSLD